MKRLQTDPRESPPERGDTRAGFTLIELLAVIVIIAMLLGIAATAAQWAFRVARVKRYEMTCRVLETAIMRYRHEYKSWPIPTTEYTGTDGKYLYTFSQEDGADGTNDECLSMLRRDNAGNRSHIQFLDESAIFVDKAGRMMTLNAAGPGSYPFVYRNRDNAKGYFRVRINVDTEQVWVD